MDRKKTPSKKSKKATAAEKQSPDFEASIDRLRDIVTSMEHGNLTLSGSLEKYEEGVKCLKDCYRALDEAKQRIELLIDLDDDGRLVTTPFDSSATGFRQASEQNSADDDSEEEVEEYEDSEGSFEEDEDGYDEEPEVDGSDRLF